MEALALFFVLPFYTSPTNIDEIMEQNPELALAWQFIENTGTHLFLTGKGRDRKTTFLRAVEVRKSKAYGCSCPNRYCSYQCRRRTIHSFFQLPCPYVPDTSFSADGKAQYRFVFGKINSTSCVSIDLLVIDEISMVRADLLDAIDVC